MPGFGGYAGALGAGMAQGFDPAYQQAVERAGQIALGKTLQLLSQGQQQPQQPPIQPPQQAPMGGGMPPPMPPPQGSMPPQPQGGPPMGGQPGGGVPPQMPQRPMGGPPIGSPPQGQMQPQGGQPPPQMQGWGGQQQGGMLDWRNVLQAVQQANPGAPPQVIAAAVSRAVPLMNSQAQVEWKNYIAPQLAQQRIGVAEHAIESREGIAGANIQSREKIAGENIQSRENISGQNIQSREKIATQKEQDTQSRFNIRETRITAHQAVTADQAWQRLDQQRKAMEARIKQGGDRQALSQWRAILDAQHKRATEIIQGYSANNALPPDVRKQLLKDSDEAYQRAIKELNPPSTFSDRFTGGGQSSP